MAAGTSVRVVNLAAGRERARFFQGRGGCEGNFRSCWIAMASDKGRSDQSDPHKDRCELHNNTFGMYDFFPSPSARAEASGE
jgi:hypothetical protein